MQKLAVLVKDCGLAKAALRRLDKTGISDIGNKRYERHSRRLADQGLYSVLLEYIRTVRILRRGRISELFAHCKH